MSDLSSATFVIGDIHGGLVALQQALGRSPITASSTLIFLGDYVDGWSQSPQVLDFLIELSEKMNCVFIRGNHDDLLLEWLTNSNPNFNSSLWYNHGGEATVKAYQTVSSEIKQKHIAFLRSLKDYYLDEQNRLFIHAGFTNIRGVDFEYFSKMFYWDRTLWETALSVDQNLSKASIFYPKRLKLYREIYIGHTPVTRIGETTPVFKNGVWNVDTGAAFNGPVTVMDITTKAYWQSDPLPLLYPNEKGRSDK